MSIRTQRRPARPLLSIGIINLFFGLAGVLSDGVTPRWVGLIFIIIGGIATSHYVDQAIGWFEQLSARLAFTAHEPLHPHDTPPPGTTTAHDGGMPTTISSGP